MPNIKQAKKRVRQQQKQHDHHASMRTKLKSSIRKLRELVQKALVEDANKQLKSTIKLLQNLAHKKIIKSNKRDRLSSQLAQKVKNISIKSTS
jgi:small subunit ribosomal protein S20